MFNISRRGLLHILASAVVMPSVRLQPVAPSLDATVVPLLVDPYFTGSYLGAPVTIPYGAEFVLTVHANASPRNVFDLAFVLDIDDGSGWRARDTYTERRDLTTGTAKPIHVITRTPIGDLAGVRCRFRAEVGQAIVALTAALRALPPTASQTLTYWPSDYDAIEHGLAAAALKSGERFLDLGSGDGRVVLMAMRRGAVATGIERDPELVRKSRALIPVQRRADQIAFSGAGVIVEADYYNVTWAQYDVLATTASGDELARVRAKFDREKKPGARLVRLSDPIEVWR